MHGSRVNLKWGVASGASQYRVSRDGVLLATVSGTTYLDIQASPKQAYTYSVAALNSSGASAPETLYVQTTIEAADRAYLPTKNGPAICGRSGDQSSQDLVMQRQHADRLDHVYSKPDDWGYASDRSWIAAPMAPCPIAAGSAPGTRHSATISTEPPGHNPCPRTTTSATTKTGHTCRRRMARRSAAGPVTSLPRTWCATFHTPTGWTTSYSKPDDWGYATDRSWIANPDGTVSYCRRVGTGDQALCDNFDGTTWTQSMSPHYDFGYDQNRAYLPTKNGPAICRPGR